MAGFLDQALVLIPALNESLCLGATIRRWRALGARSIRVVDNGSTDDTALIARGTGAEVVTEPRRGYGAAAWRGLQNPPAGLEWILFSSADGSDQLTHHEALQWQQQVDAGCDLIIGDRVTPAMSREHLKAVQSFGNRLCCLLIGLGWGKKFNDMGSLRLIRRTALERLDLQDRSFGWNVEMQVRAIEHGLRMVELPVAYHPRTAGASKISGSFLGTVRAGRSILWMMTGLWLTRRRTVRPDLAPLAGAQADRH